MTDYTQYLPEHEVHLVGKNDLYIELYRGDPSATPGRKISPPLLFVHGAYTGSWMWSKYIPHFVENGWTCYALNLRSHYKSRVMDLSRITVDDYMEDIREVLSLIAEPPVLIGFSMGGILSQKIAETADLAGLIVIDSSISKEVHDALPYPVTDRIEPGIIMPAPIRPELETIDESSEDIAFQRQYLQMESAKAFRTFSALCGAKGISIDGSLITCPSLVIKAVLSEDEDQRGQLTAKQLGANYVGLWDTTHTGVLVGQGYKEVVDIMLEWLGSIDLE
ncbi:2-succinyl-6-hydroxy-2, 4-cyclohexadiene-1-carboxylate synthase [Paenibacillus sp. JJ-100]|uniref:alpha/beta fold hydrolase n=1 Tax=Paenibacillus sp. JJ-100 TaxID=2974896 RepID=UPI0022FF6ED6|nr:alpha/beta fold hydrolase [Paenibacillus sp. JJ-100]CAI6073379.1 2-succinyl-6-hydroxy-2, 4-cyclohexadiene-1-carboxylate synthase [Paenibacillus sp. JJ-100]